MDLPVVLPERFLPLKGMEDENAIIVWLEDRPEDLITFFENACADEAWVVENPSFTHTLLVLFTDTFHTLTLPYTHAERAHKAIRDHYVVLAASLPHDITVQVEEGRIEANSLMVATASPYLFNLFHTDCIDGDSLTMRLKSGSFACFLEALEFIYSGKVKELWKKDREQTERLMREAGGWDLQGLVALCAFHLKRYFNMSNAITYLEMGRENQWASLCYVCYEFFNKQETGIRFLSYALDFISVEFVSYREEGIDLFQRLKHLTTHLKFNGTMVDDPHFSDLVAGMKNLVALDLSATRLFSERLMDIPVTVEELDVSSCDWIDDATLKRLVEHLPALKKLNLESNGNIRYSGWSTLYKLKALMHLDVARCHQIQDEDLKLICRSCPYLESLNLEECSRVTDAGFIEIAKKPLPLLWLNVARTNVSNTPLAEICLHCKKLKYLDISRCSYVTEKGGVRLHQLYPQITLRG